MTDLRLDDAFGGNPAENYERYFVPAVGSPLAADLVEAAGVRAGERVLDVACGTGIVARLAADRVGAGGSVAGLDPNPGMLAVARAVTPPGVEIQWHEAPAEQMPLGDAWCDVVLCQMGLQFVLDRAAAVREMHRTLKPGGRLALNVPGPTPPVMGVLAARLERHIGPEAAGFVNHVFSLHDEAELEAMLAGAGFQSATVRAHAKVLPQPDPGTFLWGYLHGTPLAGDVGKLSQDARRALEAEVLREWQRFTVEGSLVLEVRMVVATATK